MKPLFLYKDTQRPIASFGENAIQLYFSTKISEAEEIISTLFFFEMKYDVLFLQRL